MSTTCLGTEHQISAQSAMWDADDLRNIYQNNCKESYGYNNDKRHRHRRKTNDCFTTPNVNEASSH